MALSKKQMDSLRSLACGLMCTKKQMADRDVYETTGTGGQDLPTSPRPQPQCPQPQVQHLEDETPLSLGDIGVELADKVIMGGGDSPRYAKVEEEMLKAQKKRSLSFRKYMRNIFSLKHKSEKVNQTADETKPSKAQDEEAKGGLPFGVMLMDLTVEEFLNYKPKYQIRNLPFIIVTTPEEDGAKSFFV